MAKWHKKKRKHMKCRKIDKIIKKVHKYERNFRYELMKISKHKWNCNHTEVPASLLFNSEGLRTTAQRKQRAKDLHEAQKDSKLKLQLENRSLDDLIDEATQKVQDFKMLDDQEPEGPKSSSVKLKSFYTEFKKVVEIADVILEVLDARDPLGSRCLQVEQLVINSSKRLVLVLNKIDLIPKSNVNEWLRYLRQELPTVAFKASIQTQNENLFQSEAAEVHLTESLLSSHYCLGASLLMKLLRNYCRNQNLQTQIKVGVVGFPNVGKRSVIKSLKHFHCCTAGATLGITNAMQGLSLDNEIEILDNPGVVYAKDISPVTLAICNAVKAENLNNIISAAEAIVERVNHAQLCVHYRVPQFSSCYELLCSLATKFNKFGKDGNPDFEEGAKMLINDWNSGIIKYYTHPPEKFIQYVHVSSEYKAVIGKAFDISLIEEQIELDKAPLLFPPVSIGAKSTQPTEGFVEEMNADDNVIAKSTDEFGVKEENKRSVEDESNILLIQYKLNKLMRKKYKKMKHRKKFDKVAFALSESIHAVSSFE